MQVADKIICDGKSYNVDTVHQIMDLRSLAERQTDKFWLFHGRFLPFSNFFIAEFTISGNVYNCAEQYIQLTKASVAGDREAADKIMTTTDPAEMKRVGATVKVNTKTWVSGEGKNAVKTALRAKFSQNETLKQCLLNTGKKSLVECNKFDNTWGIGLSLGDPLAQDCTTWKGKNLLGVGLDEARQALAIGI
jgi:ribA/ribD-fused uncharacterized protein